MKIFYKVFSLSTLLIFLGISSFAQQNVGINTAIPNSNAVLDIVSPSNNTGVLVPRLTAAQRIAITGLGNAENGLLVYDTDSSCFFYWNNPLSAWRSLCGGTSISTGTVIGGGGNACSVQSVSLTVGSAGNTSGLVRIVDSCGNIKSSPNAAWITTGNFNTSPGTNYIGTNDAQDFIFKTGGSTAFNERLRMTSAGRLVANNTTAASTDVFSSYGTGAAGAINSLGTRAVAGYITGTGTGIYGEGLGAAYGVHGKTTTGRGVYGEASSNGYGVVGENATGTGIGVWAKNGNFSGTALQAENTLGGYAGYFSSTGGIAGNDKPSVWIQSNNVVNTMTLRVDNGTATNTGTGIAGVGSGVNTAYHAGASTGVSGTGKTFGVFGMTYNGSSGGTTAGGLFIDSMSLALDFYAMTAAYTANTNYKIIGTGAVSTIVNDVQNKPVVLYAPEAPEALFEDYGSGQLVNGSTYISIDPTFAKNVAVNEKHPLRVLVQLEDDCNGVYVTEKTEKGFLVKELANGKSNAKFTYHIIANRADEYKNGELVSKYQDLRFTPFDIKSIRRSGVAQPSNK
ncbi:MAG: hypothetical protein J0M08_09880 [Bacteroidetes bacterium]|nr:hypothetical protein [Bacteroidota bacterium]